MAFDLEFRFSGGASNSNPAASLGGAMSSVSVGADALAWAASSMAGVTLIRGHGNPSGAGTLVFVHGSPDHTLKWQAPGGSVAYERSIMVSGSVDDRYLLDTFDHQAIVVDIDASALPGADDSNGVTVTAASGNLFDNVPASESLVGATEHRCAYIKNASATLTHDLRLFIRSQPGAGEALAIGMDPAGVNATATTIAATETEPAGVTFAQPATYADPDALTVTLAPGDYAAMWLCRTVPPVNLTTLSEDLSRIGVFSISS